MTDLETRLVGASEPPDAELLDVWKTYDNGIVAVQALNLAIPHGEFFSLLGPSGCGKSSTLRMIAGLEPTSRGEIFIRGVAMKNRSANKRATNMVFQRLALFPHLDVAHNVGFGLKLRRLPAKELSRRVDRILDLVRLAGFQRRPIHQLSGGQQQRVAIARALVLEPALLLLDEPLGALDLQLRLQMQAALKEIQRDSLTTFVYVTHDQTEALAMSDRIAIMNAGRVLQVGTPSDIYEHPKSRFVAEFVGDANLLEGVTDGQGIFRGQGVEFPVEGQGTIVSLRPQHIRIGLAGPDDRHSVFRGRVEAVVYLGSVRRYRVRLNPSLVIASEVSNSGDNSSLAVGDTVQVGWERSRATVLAD